MISAKRVDRYGLPSTNQSIPQHGVTSRGLGKPRDFLYPLQVLGDPGVDAVFTRLGTFLTPAGDPREKPGALDLGGVGTSAVPPAGVTAPGREARAEHVLQDGGGGALQAGRPVNEGHLEDLEDGGRPAAEKRAAPAAHRPRPVLQQGVGELPAADADGSDVAVEAERPVQLQEGDIVVVLVDRGVVRRVGKDFHHFTPLLRVVFLVGVVFTCRDQHGLGSMAGPATVPCQFHPDAIPARPGGCKGMSAARPSPSGCSEPGAGESACSFSKGVGGFPTAAPPRSLQPAGPGPPDMTPGTHLPIKCQRSRCFCRN